MAREERADLEFYDRHPFLRQICPRLREDVTVEPQRFRGEVSYILQNPVSLQFFRVREPEYEVLRRLDGTHSLDEIHTLVAREMTDPPSFRELSQFVFQLKSANMLALAPGQEDDKLAERIKEKRSQRTKALFSNFLFPRVPLVDPERFLVRTYPYVKCLFTRTFLYIWAVCVLGGIVLFLCNAEAMVRSGAGVLEPENLPLIWLVFIGLKTVHEFAHAFAAKRCGVEVHRLGVMLLVFTPVAYVDVTGLWAEPGRWKKVLVGVSGMISELFIAAWAMALWCATEPGVINSLAYNIVFVAGFSTVLFNANPLLRYDGYYILMDWVELPNLRPNSWKFIKQGLQRILLGLDVPMPPTNVRERFWYVGYGIASFCYRMLIVFGIIMFVATKLFVLGLLLALGALVSMILLPIGKAIHFILLSPQTRPHRLRCVGVLAGGTALAIVIFGLIPFTEHVDAPCVVQPLREAVVRASQRGFVQSLEVRDGQRVSKGDVLAVCDNPELRYRLTRDQSDLEQARRRFRALLQDNFASAQAVRKRMHELEKTVAARRAQVDELVLKSPIDGYVIGKGFHRVHGRFLEVGDELVRVASTGSLHIVAVLTQEDVSRVKTGSAAHYAQVKLRSRPGENPEGTVTKVDPQATEEVPPLALTDAGGGPVLLEGDAARGRQRTLHSWFRVEIALEKFPPEAEPGLTGLARIRVRDASLLAQGWRKALHFFRTKFFIL